MTLSASVGQALCLTACYSENEAVQAAAAIHAGPGSELGQAISKLRRAIDAFEADRPLFRGECVEDIPEGLRRWLANSGQLRDAAG